MTGKHETKPAEAKEGEQTDKQSDQISGGVIDIELVADKPIMPKGPTGFESKACRVRPDHLG